MLDQYEKLVWVDADERDTGMRFEVNWAPDDAKTNECKVIKMTLKDGTVHYIKREMLNAFLWLIGTAEDQRKMLPQTIIKTKWYETVVSVKATKDIHKGEEVVFPIKISLPDERREAIQEIKAELKSGILTPDGRTV